MEETTWTELRQSTGKCVEDIGRMLRRKKPHTYEDLTDLHNALVDCAVTLVIIRDAATKPEANV